MMKKVISVALALLLVFALTASFAAKDSPEGKEYYNITVSWEPEDGSLGTAETDKNKVAKDATGDDAIVTLTALEDGDGYFTLWIIEGDYEIVEGDESSTVLKIRPKSDIHAIASYSVDEDFLTIFVTTRGDGTASADPTKVQKGSNNTVTLTAVDGLDTFVIWELNCKYDIVSGSLTDRTLVIRPYTDIHAVAVFESSGTVSTPDSEPTESTSSNPGSTPEPSPGEPSGPSNGSGTSPKTGDPLFIVIGLAVLALGAGTLAVKKIKE